MVARAGCCIRRKQGAHGDMLTGSQVNASYLCQTVRMCECCAKRIKYRDSSPNFDCNVSSALRAQVTRSPREHLLWA